MIKKMNRFKGIRFLAMVLLISLVCCGCQLENAGTDSTGEATDSSKKTEDTKVTKEIFAMDTIMDLTVYGDTAEEAVSQAVSVIQTLDKTFSVTNAESDIYKINHAKGKKVTVSDDTYQLLTQCQKYAKMTDGLFDVSIYPLVQVWGFTTDDMHVPSKAERKQALTQIDYKKIKLSSENGVRIGKNMELDLGAAAKGYLSQKLMDLFETLKVDSAIVSLGGNVQTIGKKPDGSEFVVGITDPSDGASVYGTFSVCGKAVITSGIYQRYFEENGVRYHHIMDKRTGMPADNTLSSVTVISDDGCMADALATALYVMGEEKAIAFQKEHPEIDIILIRKDGTFWQSDENLMVIEK